MTSLVSHQGFIAFPDLSGVTELVLDRGKVWDSEIYSLSDVGHTLKDYHLVIDSLFDIRYMKDLPVPLSLTINGTRGFLPVQYLCQVPDYPWDKVKFANCVPCLGCPTKFIAYFELSYEVVSKVVSKLGNKLVHGSPMGLESCQDDNNIVKEFKPYAIVLSYDNAPLVKEAEVLILDFRPNYFSSHYPSEEFLRKRTKEYKAKEIWYLGNPNLVSSSWIPVMIEEIKMRMNK